MIGVWMQKIFGPHWRTTLFALLAAVFGFIAADPQYFPAVLVDLSHYLTAAGIIGFGMQAQDRSA